MGHSTGLDAGGHSGLDAAGQSTGLVEANPLEPLTQLFRDLRTSADGLSAREAARRLEVSGPNQLTRRGGRRWPGELARQCTHPLAVLLAAAAVLAWASGSGRLAIAVAAVIVLNASFSFVQEVQAERAVEALAAFLPERARVLRDGARLEIDAAVVRSAAAADPDVPLLQAADLVFSGTECTAGEARAVVTATGMRTELGRLLLRRRRAASS